MPQNKQTYDNSLTLNYTTKKKKQLFTSVTKNKNFMLILSK